jgi:CRISPR-associated protein Csb1
MNQLNLEMLKAAVGGKYAAIRRITTLEPQGDKVFPPTYEGGEYAEEPRVVQADGKGEKKTAVVQTVLLDSVQSQANRLELALLRAYDEKSIGIPMIQVDFGADTEDPVLKEVGRLTALEAPHRMCDAIFRDSVLDGKPFRESPVGVRLNSAKSANATVVFEICPSALIFGFWDSTGPRGGLGAKVQRALVSEIVGYEVEKGKRTSSRIDPLQIENNLEIFAKEGGGWTFSTDLAAKKDGEPVKLKPSELNHGNITPSFRDKNKKENHGGVTLAYAIQNTVLSLAALRRLRFPVEGVTKTETDRAARTVLAALGLAAICCLDQDGYDLRSRCLLDGKPGTFEFVGGGQTSEFSLDVITAADLLAQAAQEAIGSGLKWPIEKPLTLKPSGDLSKLVSESRKRAMAESVGG